jgi:hypothetical protein
VPLSDIPLSFLVVIFLAIFVLIGIYPAFKRNVLKIRKLLEDKTRSGDPFASMLDDAHAEIFTDYPSSEPMNDFEIIVLRRIAMARGKVLSRKQVNEPLLFGDAVLGKTLRSLYRRRMISLRRSKFIGQRIVLSEAGRRYALEQGYIVQIQDRKGLI